MPNIDINRLYQILLKYMGPQGWWPADSKSEIILGAILVQNTNWKNVKKSLILLANSTQFDAQKITELPLDTLQSLIRPSGFYKNKSKTIFELFAWLSIYNWDYEKIAKKYGPNLRKQLLSFHGIGPETADVLLVYVFNQAVFIADNYARKLFGLLSNTNYPTYQSLKKAVELPTTFTYQDSQEFHGLIDEFGKIYTKTEEHFKTSFLYDLRTTLERNEEASK